MLESVWPVPIIIAFVGLLVLAAWSRYGGGDGGDHL
jgi:hypothetical protein